MTNLFRAFSNWAERPPDQRFWNLQELYDATLRNRQQAATATVKLADVRVEAVDEDLKLVGKTGVTAAFTHWSFGQLSRIAGAPASYLRELPATLAAQNINYGLKARENGTESKLLLHQSTPQPVGIPSQAPEDQYLTPRSEYHIRALTSDRYTRIWNHEIVQRLQGLPDTWRVPPARPAHQNDPRARQATREDLLDRVGGLSVREGDLIAPAGLYASDEDLFAFLVDESRPIDDGTPEGLARGFFISNSEVGKASFRITTFLYRHVCGNHIVWDAKQLQEIKIRHVGTADTKAFNQLRVELIKYAESSASDDEARIATAKRFTVGADIHEVVDFIFKNNILSRSAASEAYQLVQPDVDGNPNQAWGLAQGVTRLSQQQVNASARVQLDRAAGKVLEVAF